MKNIHLIRLAIFVAMLGLFFPGMNLVTAQSNSVHAVLFYSPTCPHCQVVMSDVLPPLLEKYGERLIVTKIDVGTQDGQSLYKSAIEHFNTPEERIGVPTLIMGEIVLVGAREIPEMLPGLIQEGLSSGGVDWPSIPGLKASIAKLEVSNSDQNAVLAVTATPEITTQEQIQAIETPQSGFAYKFAQDPTGNTIAVVVLVLMLLSVVWVIVSFLRGNQDKKSRWPRWIIPVLVIIGLFVAAYMSYVEISQAYAICGPLGDCNAVQRSPYATLFGFLPVGILGFIGYLLIGLTWLLQQIGPEKWRKFFALAAWGLAWIGILFSIYLTFLEPFVIGATCAWCITSALVMTLIFLATTGPAIDAMRIEEDEEE